MQITNGAIIERIARVAFAELAEYTASIKISEQLKALETLAKINCMMDEKRDGETLAIMKEPTQIDERLTHQTTRNIIQSDLRKQAANGRLRIGMAEGLIGTRGENASGIPPRGSSW